VSAIEFRSTRGAGASISLSEAVRRGLAPDGGLYMPDRLPVLDRVALSDPAPLPLIARSALAGFFAGDRLEGALGDIADAAFNIEAPTSAVARCPNPLFALELFHGPTAAFKDFGARFLAEALQRLESAEPRVLTILVATSGDTGGAVAAAFHRRPWARVVILYPKGQVSPLQEQQLTCWGENVLSLRVQGSFDDCQRLVKEALVDTAMRAQHRFSSANSINIGRLLPQMVYYIASSFELQRRTGQAASYVIPAGNLGNAFAAVWARSLGAPIGRIILAHSANRTVPDYLNDGVWRPRPSVATLASAMDVGNPSNMERLRALFPSVESLRGQLSADWVTDHAIRERIAEDFRLYGRVWCPHTATAAEVYSRLPQKERVSPWVIVATAHPAKFNEVVEPVIGQPVEIPESLGRLLGLPQVVVDLPPTLSALRTALT